MEATSLLIEENRNINTKLLSSAIDNARILIAEDHDFNRLLLIKLLQQFKCETYEAKDGQELLYLLPEVNPDLILLDLHMPIMNGFDVCEKIRNRKDYLKDVPIIIMTADIITMNISELDKTGANDIIYKPIDAEKLFRKIDKILNKSTKFDLPYKNEDIPNQLTSSINKATLYAECKKLTNIITKSFLRNDLEKARSYSHKLKGIAGLSKNLVFINEVENMKDSLSTEQQRKSLSRIAQIIEDELK